MTPRLIPYAPLLFTIQTLLAQIIAIGITASLWTVHSSIVASLFLAPLLGYLIARFLGLSAPWQFLNGILPLTIASTLAVEVPSFVFLIPFVALILIYAPALWTRVPYYPTSRESYPLILAELPLDRPFIFVDIGCGFGDLLFFLAQHRPNGQFIGVEIGFIPMIVARLKARILKRRVRIYFQSMWNVSLEECDFVYTFLSPAPMAKLWDKACQEMKPTSSFMSNTFEVPAIPDQTVRVKDQRGGTIQIFRMKNWATRYARDKTTAHGR